LVLDIKVLVLVLELLSLGLVLVLDKQVLNPSLLQCMACYCRNYQILAGAQHLWSSDTLTHHVMNENSSAGAVPQVWNTNNRTAA